MNTTNLNMLIDESIDSLNLKRFGYSELYFAKILIKEILFMYEEIPTDLGFIVYLNSLLDVIQGKEIK